MSSKAVERWTGFLKTATAQGSSKPLFSDVVLGPVVVVDLEGDDPPRELRERTDAENRSADGGAETKLRVAPRRNPLD